MRRTAVSIALILTLVATGALASPPAPGGLVMKPSPHTVEALKQNDCWAVAAISCEWVRVTERGTRSQSMSFRGRVLAASDQAVPSLIAIEQFVADDAILTPDGSYLVILLCDTASDGSPTWKVIQREPLDDADAGVSVMQTERAVRAALR